MIKLHLYSIPHSLIKKHITVTNNGKKSSTEKLSYLMIQSKVHKTDIFVLNFACLK